MYDRIIKCKHIYKAHKKQGRPWRVAALRGFLMHKG